MIKNKTDITPPSFNDLDFQPHANVSNAVQARLVFGDKDKFEISVVSMNGDKNGFGLYGNASEGTYEVAMFYGDDMLPLSKYDDVLAWQTTTQIDLLMRDASLNGFTWVDLLYSLRKERLKMEFIKKIS